MKFYGSLIAGILFTLSAFAQSHNYDNENVIFSENGKVGIGAQPDPDYKLFLWGGLKANGNMLINQSHFTFAPTTGHGVINWGGSGNGNLYFRTLNVLGDRTTYSNKVTIRNDGNFGIGVSDPSEKLVVSGNIRLRGDNSTIKFNRITNATDIANISYNDQESSFSFSANNKDLIFNSQLGFAESMRIKSNGNVGIGTELPSNKLDVNGTIHAKEVLVDLNFPGPDYVFEDDYPLQDLNSLEQYLRENKHLPEVPSAARMESKGVNMMEMQMLLLKKVEELTLHIISQQKEIEDLKSEFKKTK